MALFYEARLFISDENGVAISGGKARFRDANTTDLTPLFSDATLATPLTNPVVADGNGWTPQIFAAEGTVCDLQYLTAANVAVPSRNYVDVVALGASTGSTQTFTGGTRYKLSDSAGVVIAEAGDPSPDNIGGSMTDQGWAGTQGDTRTFNYAHVNAGTSAGALKENSKKLPGVLATEGVFTAVSNIDIQLVNSPTGVQGWDIDLFDIVTSSAGTVNWTVKFSYDGGGAFKGGASDYYWMNMVLGGGVVLANPNGAATADTAIAIGSSKLASADRLSRISSTIFTPDSGAAYSSIETRFVTFEVSASAPALILSTGFGAGGYGRATHVRFTINTGTMTGKYRTIPRRGTGDA